MIALSNVMYLEKNNVIVLQFIMKKNELVKEKIMTNMLKEKFALFIILFTFGEEKNIKYQKQLIIPI